MGFDVNLETERGEVLATVGDSANLLHRLLERSVNEEPLLAEIDWYGDTVFNRPQMQRFRSHGRALAKNSKSLEEAKIVQQIDALAEQCESGIHLYLKFVGD